VEQVLQFDLTQARVEASALAGQLMAVQASLAATEAERVRLQQLLDQAGQAQTNVISQANAIQAESERAVQAAQEALTTEVARMQAESASLTAQTAAVQRELGETNAERERLALRVAELDKAAADAERNQQVASNAAQAQLAEVQRHQDARAEVVVGVPWHED
jgi:chromosome segregation ATPase